MVSREAAERAWELREGAAFTLPKYASVRVTGVSREGAHGAS
jgi:hypothetical protein